MTELLPVPELDSTMLQPATRDPVERWRDWIEVFREIYRAAEALSRTPFVPREMIGKTADVAAAMMKGYELGLDPLDSLGSIYVVHGRVGFYAEFMRRRIIQSGHQFHVIEATDNRCIVEGRRKEGGEPQRASFTAEQARKAGVDLGKYPADKLVARATSRLCRQVFPDVLSGTLIAEDIIDGLVPAADTAAEPAPAQLSVQRARRPRKPKAAATKPPAAPAEPAGDDIDELLTDDEKVELAETSAEADTPEPAAGDPWECFGVAPAEDVRMSTQPQWRKIAILLNQQGLETRDEQHDWCAAYVQRPIKTAKDLTSDEASDIITALESQEEGNTEND